MTDPSRVKSVLSIYLRVISSDLATLQEDASASDDVQSITWSRQLDRCGSQS